MFTNYLSKPLEGLCHTVKYAHDTALFSSRMSTDQLDVRSYMAYKYCQTNDFVVHTTKTNQLAFERRRDQVPAIPDVGMKTETKYLGVIIDEYMIWTHGYSC